MTNKIFFHADDFGMLPDTSDRILDCATEEAINSVGIVPNGCPEYAMSEIMKRCPKLYISAHLNIVEGTALCSHEELPNITNESGRFVYSFDGLLLLILKGKKRELYEEARREFTAQLKRLELCSRQYDSIGIASADSHQHVHMIPVIFDAMTVAIKDCGMDIGYIRIPAEPWRPVLLRKDLWGGLSVANIIKNLLIHFLWCIDKKKYKSSGLKTRLFCGLLFSGNMDERLYKTGAEFLRVADSRGLDAEFTFHPGFLLENEQPFDIYKSSFNSFHRSEGRRKEYDILHDSRLKAFLTDVHIADVVNKPIG